MTKPNLKFKRTPFLLVTLPVLTRFFTGFKMAQDMGIERADVKAAQKLLDLNFSNNEIEQHLPKFID